MKFQKWPLQTDTHTHTQSQIVAYWAATFAAKKLLQDNVTDPEGQENDENVEHIPLQNDEHQQVHNYNEETRL